MIMHNMLIESRIHYSTTHKGRHLIYPSLSVLQFSMATATSGDFFIPKKKYAVRRLGINVGFQANYGLPYRLQDFYKFPTWARALVDVVKGRYLPTEVITARAVRKRSALRPLSAGDIYTALEEILVFSGYDKDCVLKSVCELSHSPFHDLEEDLYAEIVHFFLTPSEHQAFDVSERKIKRKYELAERFGKMGADCTMIHRRGDTSASDVIIERRLQQINGVSSGESSNGGRTGSST
ncbi:uncharacterized protein LOC134222125 [Armigeres subalbatus]|uniref:uncharacterized protein LOC134222125 n=1 Tax=Armigeres subalbatus TaxID=124917 RepID=UPI002ED60775